MNPESGIWGKITGIFRKKEETAPGAQDRLKQAIKADRAEIEKEKFPEHNDRSQNQEKPESPEHSQQQNQAA